MFPRRSRATLQNATCKTKAGGRCVKVRLPNVPSDHKCFRLHGHSFRSEVHVRGEVGADSGWIMDFADSKIAFTPIFDALDHRYLNEVDGLANPTSEVLAKWIWRRLAPTLP